MLTFESAGDDERSHPWCWNEFTVARDDGRPVWSFKVPYGAYSGEERCGPNFPLAYGQAPPRAETTIAAKPVEPGRLYVSTGLAAGSLEGAFRLRREGNRLIIDNVEPGSSEALEARERLYAWQRSTALSSAAIARSPS